MSKHRVCSRIYTGTPCEPEPMGYEQPTLSGALDDFRDYVRECQRIGNSWQDAYMTVTCDHWPERTYTVGPRGGIVLQD